jgi:hypothetical protein
MNTPKEPERITLAEGLNLLESHFPAEQAKASLRKAFKEMLTLKPTFMGVSLDLKELFRRAKAWWKHNK